jgi:hypothetical protein
MTHPIAASWAASGAMTSTAELSTAPSAVASRLLASPPDRELSVDASVPESAPTNPVLKCVTCVLAKWVSTIDASRSYPAPLDFDQ